VGARRFGPALGLAASSTESCDSRTVGLAVGDDGRSTVGWSIWDGPHERSIYAAQLNADGRIAGIDRVAGGDFGGLAVASDGTAVLSWDDGVDPTRGVFGDGPLGMGFMPPGAQPGHAFAALRAAGSAHFGAPERVSSDEEETGPPSTAFDPLTREPMLLWFSYPLDAPPAVGSLRTSTRAPGLP
jgi:hypothetical protein